MTDFKYDNLREAIKRISEQEQEAAADDGWKMIDDTPPEPVYTIPVDARAIRHLTKAYEKLEYQVFELAKIMKRIPVIEEQVANSENTMLAAISSTIKAFFDNHVPELTAKAIINVFKGPETKAKVVSLCRDIFQEELKSLLDGNEFTEKIIQICNQYNTKNAYDTIISRLNEISLEMSTLEHRIERLEKGGHGT